MNLDNLSIVLTGGAGFIGSNIAEYLLKNNVKYLRIFDNLSTGDKKNIEHLLNTYSNVEFIWGDIREIDMCRSVCKGMNAVCHQAALGSVPRSIDNPFDSHNVNVNGYFNMILAAKENNIKRFVYASSSSVYGDNVDTIKCENNVGNALSPYGATKKIDEIYGDIFWKTFGIESIGLRYFNVFGPRQNPNGAYAALIPKFINSILNNESPIINGDGSYRRDFTYIDNVIEANILALTTTNSECFGEMFNIGAGGCVSVYEVYSSIVDVIKSNCAVKYGPPRPGDIPHSNASVSKANQYLNYSPSVQFKEGLIKTIEYFKTK